MPHVSSAAADETWILPRSIIPQRFTSARLEFYVRRRSRTGVGLEICVVHVEAQNIRPQAVGELAHERVVVLQGLVIAPSRNLDAVLSTGQLVLQAHELIART